MAIFAYGGEVIPRENANIPRQMTFQKVHDVGNRVEAIRLKQEMKVIPHHYIRIQPKSLKVLRNTELFHGKIGKGRT